MFAWLVDRFTPWPKEEPVEVTGAQLRRYLNSLPTDMVDFGDHANLALSPMSHRDLALLAFTARYGRGYAREGESLVLAPTERATVPDPVPADVPVLSAVYGDALCDLGEYVARTLISVDSASWGGSLSARSIGTRCCCWPSRTTSAASSPPELRLRTFGHAA